MASSVPFSGHPHWLQAAVSMLAGQITKATTKTIQEANKVLRFAKENDDVGLEYRYIGNKDDVTFLAFSDASFACRPDLTSQGGYLVLMVNRQVAEGAEGHYNVLDWRSWKLARIARSTLSAEGQAASEAADSLLFTTTFWNLLWNPWLPLDAPTTAKMSVEPNLIVDAKALYDLLVRPEVQATSGTDKRTMVEVLVTQDKLKCAGANTRWTSSETQYADGMTKQGAAQLLAERLRTHLVKIVSDTTFQAAKKKTPQQRKANTQKYAAKRPNRAMMAMFATCLSMSPTMAMSPVPNIHEHYFDFTLDVMVILFVTITAIFMGMWFLGYGLMTIASRIFTQWFGIAVEDGNPQGASPTTHRTNHVEVQTDGGMMILMAEHNRQLGVFWAENAQREQQLIQNYEQREQQLIQDYERRIQTIFQNPIYYTNSGRCWHADPDCLRRYSSTTIHEKRFCTFCAHLLGRPREDD